MKTQSLIQWTLCLALSSAALATESAPDVMMNLFILGADLSQIQISDLKKLEKGGARGFELPGTVSTPEVCETLGVYTKSTGYPIALNVAVDKDRDPSALDEKRRAAGIAYLKSRIDCAVALGATTLAGPIVLPWGYFPEYSGKALHEKYLNPKLEVAVASIREVADYGLTRGVKLAFEPLTHWEMPGLNTLRETLAFIKRVNHANFGVTLDISHEVLDGEGPEVFSKQVEELASLDKIFYVQVSAPHRGDVERSWLPWADFFRPLKKVSWNGHLAVEMMNAVSPFAAPSGGGLRLSRIPFEDPFEVAARSIRVTKEKWLEARE